MKFVLVGLYCGPLLMLIPLLIRTYAKNHVSGSRVSDYRVSGEPPIFCDFKNKEATLSFSRIGTFDGSL